MEPGDSDAARYVGTRSSPTLGAVELEELLIGLQGVDESASGEYDDVYIRILMGDDAGGYAFAILERRSQHHLISPGEITGRRHLISKIADKAHDKAAETGQEILSNKLEGAYERVAEGWVVTDPARFEHYAEVISNVKDGMHDALLGKPIEAAGIYIGLPDGMAFVCGQVAAAIGLPGIDGVLVNVRRAFQIAGVAFGLATANPMLSIASFKAFIGSEVGRLAAKAAFRIGGHDRDITPTPTFVRRSPEHPRNGPIGVAAASSTSSGFGTDVD